ncbi:acyl-CoA dehydrogenase [Dietzia kunjamensis]|uniref:acyl-CoA dehydrogenase n=1 Tax=Dietzia kunjamensis TaxID=322509 RepID=UPI00336801A5
MRSTVLSRQDVDFLLHDWLKVGDLLAVERYAEHSRETIDAVLDVAQSVAERDFAPYNRLGDDDEPVFDGRTVTLPRETGEALQKFAETGLLAGTLPAEEGGISLPETVARACFTFFQAANIATASYPMLTMANAALLREHGSPEQVETFVGPMLEGRFFGTMCLSEPHAGSSLADVTTKATPAADGTYRLSGTKMWISGGDHELSENIIHLVLARVAGARPGVKGLSLFIVPKVLVNADGSLGERNDVTLIGLNHKMGYRGTTNTLLGFGQGEHTPDPDAPGAVGYLVGEENQGLHYMFHMMNEARIGVGAGAVALGYTGHLHTVAYATSRPQGRLPGSKDPTSQPVDIVEHPDVRRMLLASKSYVEGGLALVLYAARLLDVQKVSAAEADRHRAGLLLDILTPIVKSWPSQWCLAANDLAIQVHGGAGYTRDYPVEQFYRDNRLNPIHEGTHGIQGLDLLGRKVRQDNGAALRALADEIRATTARAVGEWAAPAARIDHHLDALCTVTEELWALGPDSALANATAYLEAMGHLVVGWIWLDVALAADDTPGPFHEGKRHAARFFFRYESPRIDQHLEVLRGGPDLLLDVRREWL